MLAAAVFFLIITPGPGVLSTAGVGSGYGVAAGSRYVFGLFLGTNMVALAVVSGLAALILAQPGIRDLLLYASAAYLLYLAARIALAGSKLAFIERAKAPGVMGGLLLQAINPKAYAVNTTLFTGFAFMPGNTTAEMLIKFAIMNVIWIPIHFLWLWAAEGPAHDQRLHGAVDAGGRRPRGLRPGLIAQHRHPRRMPPPDEPAAQACPRRRLKDWTHSPGGLARLGASEFCLDGVPLIMPRLFAFLLLLTAFVSPAQADDLPEADLWSALARGEAFAILRHALAPGTGDPQDFTLGDCSTQRNLNGEGRRQSEAIGKRFAENGIPEAAVFSSAWCRCRETAELMALGEVRELAPLNSFFRRFERREEQTQAIKAWLADYQGSWPLVLVSHQVNISALTGRSTRSGEIVVARLLPGGQVEVLGSL